MDEVGWFVIGFLLFFAMLIGGAMWDDGRKHERQMECMKLRGEWIDKTCIFRDHKPQ